MWRPAEIVGLVFAGGLALLALNALHVVGFTYPKPVLNDPLLDPVRVVEVGDDYLLVEDGRRIGFDASMFANRPLDDIIRESNYRIDIEDREAFITPFIDVDKKQRICGTQFSALIEIPLIPVEVRTRRRGSIMVDSIEQVAAAPD